MGKQNRSKQKPNQNANRNVLTQATANSEPPTIKIILAIIAAIATITFAIIGYLATIKGTLLPIDATQTAEALHTSIAMTNQAQLPTDSFTLTPGVASDLPLFTITPSLTEILATPESDENSRGLSAKCFDARYWYPQYEEALSKDANNCWILNAWSVLPQDRGFKVFINPAENKVSHWIYTPIPANARIAFTINISDFRTLEGVFGSFVFGFGDSSKDVPTGKFLIYRVINAASRNIYIYFGDPVKPDDNPLPHIGVYPKGVDQKVVLVVKEISLEVYLDEEKVFGPISLSRSERESFWIGFTLPKDGSLSASVSEFEISEIEP